MNHVERLIELRNCLAGFRFNYANEADLQRGIEQVLVKKGFIVKREVHLLSEQGNLIGRLDFLIDGDVVIETKVDGSAAELMRQIARYAQSSTVKAILVVSDRASHVLPEAFNNKPVMVLSLLRGAF
jgi:DNA-binding MurR/RpiR family transcriptional regulator